MEVDFATKLAAVKDYYQGYNTFWDRIDISGLSTQQINSLYNSLPAASYSIDRTPSGLNLGRNYAKPFELPVVPGSDFDSNISGGSYGGGNTFVGNVPANLELDPNTGLPVRQTAGATTSVGNVLPTIADKVSLAVAGVNIGARLGMSIDTALYNLNPSWWDANLPAINPETWNNLVGVNPVGDFFLRTLFGITGSNMTGYVSADMLAYYYQMLRDAGAWNSGGTSYDHPELLDYPSAYTFPLITSAIPIVIHYSSSVGYQRTISGSNIITVSKSSSLTGNEFLFLSFSPIIVNGSPQSTASSGTTHGTGTPYTMYYQMFGNQYMDANPGINVINVSGTLLSAIRDIATILIDGTSSTGIDGIGELPNSTQYPPTHITGTTPQQVLQQLKQEYPDLFTDAITERTLQDDGTVTETTYVPIPWVTDGLNPQKPTTLDDRGQDTTNIDPATGQQILPTTPQNEPPQPPTTGEGAAPIPAVPIGSASSLWAVYNPSQGELNSFGAWLWSSNFVDQLKKLFADPMQAIIGVHKVFAAPSTGGSQSIKCGYLDSGVSAAVVTSQYSSVDCGSASLREYFGNVFDYDPFTKVSIFLPFIGIVPLNTSDVMRSTISVKYRVDVITGACLAEVSVSRDGGGGILYTYGGSAIVTYPVSSGSYVGAVQAALSTAIGIGSAIATGGASLGASAGMVLGGLSQAKTQVQHSGQLSGCSGAMGGKKPYLIVSRPQTRIPQTVAEFEGIPSNSIHQLVSCIGFTKVKEVHITSKTAYDNEIQEIESLLKTGVIF